MMDKLGDPLFKAALEKAAEEGAKKALASIGLHDEDAANDVRELRGLLEGFRDAKKAVLQTLYKAATAVVIGLLATGATFKLWRD